MTSGQLSDCDLTVGGGIADIVANQGLRELGLDLGHCLLRVVHRESGLGKDHHRGIRVPVWQIHTFPLIHQHHGSLTHGALYLLMAPMADKDRLVLLSRILTSFVMDLGYQRTGGVYDL